MGARPTGTANAARVADLVAELAVPGLNPRSVAALGGAGTVRKLHQEGALTDAMQVAKARKCGGRWRSYDPKVHVTVDADAHKQGGFVCWVDDQGNKVAGPSWRCPAPTPTTPWTRPRGTWAAWWGTWCLLACVAVCDCGCDCDCAAVCVCCCRDSYCRL